MATPNNFRVKNGLTAANGVTVTTGNVVISNGQLIVNGTAINSTSISQSADNAYANGVNYADGKAADAYGNAVSVATGSSSNAYANAVLFSANADNLTSGTLSLNRLPATVNVSLGLNVTNTVSIISGNLSITAANNVAALTGNKISFTDILTESGNNFLVSITHDEMITLKNYTIANVVYSDYGEVSRHGMFSVIGLNTTNSSIYVTGVTVNTTVIAIGNTSVFSTINSTAFSGNGASLSSVNAAKVGGNSASDLRTYTETYASNATNLASGTVNSARLPTANATVAGATLLVNSVANTSTTAAAAAASVKSAYDTAISANTNAGTQAGTAYSNGVTYTDNKAANAYSNAIAIAANATNLTSGTVNVARIPTIDAVNNTSISFVATANSVKTAYDAAITANTNANTALTAAGSAYTNAIAIAANATNLTSGTVNSARLPSGNSTVAGAVVLVNSTSNTSTTAAAAAASVKSAYDAAIAANTLANTATTSASAAYSNAVTYTDTKIGTANTAMSANAGAAYTNAIAIAANATNLTSGTVNIARIPTVDAVNNTSISFVATANSVKTAYDAAIAANTNANTALTAAGAAYSNGVTYTNTKIGTANTAMAANAAAAYTNAVAFAANASNANNGTLAEPRLPFRMNQDLQTSNSPTFANGTFTASVSVGGDLIVSGNLVSTNVQSLEVADPLIKLGVNNAADTLFGGFTFHYNGSGNTTNHAGLIRSPTSKDWFLMSTYGDETAVANNNTINIADASFSYANLLVSILKAGNTTVFSTINTTSFSGVSGFFTGTSNAASHTVGTAFIANTTGITTTGFANVAKTLAAGNTTITGFTAVSSYVSVGNTTVNTYITGTQIQANQNDTVSVPSYSWSTDTTTGIFRPTAATIGVAIAGIQELSINATSFAANSLNFSGIGTLAAGNTTITGFASVSTTLNVTGITTLAANLVMANNAITRPILTGYTEHEIANTATTGTYSLDCGAANFWDLTLTGNTTIAPTNVPPATRMWAGTLAAKQDATGGRTITWPTGSKYPGGVAPPATTNANAIDLWSLMTYDAGTTWIVSLTVKGAA